MKNIHREAKTIANQFQTFTIDYQEGVKRMSIDLVSRALAIVIGDVEDDFPSTFIPERIIHGNKYIYPIYGFFILMIVVMAIMSWLYHNSY